MKQLVYERGTLRYSQRGDSGRYIIRKNCTTAGIAATPSIQRHVPGAYTEKHTSFSSAKSTSITIYENEKLIVECKITVEIAKLYCFVNTITITKEKFSIISSPNFYASPNRTTTTSVLKCYIELNASW